MQVGKELFDKRPSQAEIQVAAVGCDALSVHLKGSDDEQVPGQSCQCTAGTAVLKGRLHGHAAGHQKGQLIKVVQVGLPAWAFPLGAAQEAVLVSGRHHTGCQLADGGLSGVFCHVLNPFPAHVFGYSPSKTIL